MQASQAAAAKLLSPVLGCLTSRYPLDQFDPTTSPATPGTPPSSASEAASNGVCVESYLGSKAVEGQTARHQPKWHEPNSAEIQFAEELNQAFLVDAANQLHQMSQGSEQGEKYPKERIQGLLLQLDGALHGLRSALAEFSPPSDTQQGSGQSLALIGSACPVISGSETRDAVAKSLIAAAGYIGANDYESLTILLRVMGSLLSRGAAEFQEAIDSFSSWKSDQDVAFDPPIAALLFDEV